MRWGFLVALLLAPIASRTEAAVTILGSGDAARQCWHAAELGSFDEGLSDCNFALQNETLSMRDLAATYVNRSILLTRVLRFQDALTDCNKASRLAPDLAEVYVNRGNVFFMQRHFTDALADYDLSVSKGLAELHAAEYNRGLALERLGRRQEAEKAFRHALEIAPGFTLASEKVAEYGRTR